MPAVPHGQVWSPHWVGWMTYGMHITEVSADIRVPSIEPGARPNQIISAWVGVDGYYSRQLLQAGVTSWRTPAGPQDFVWMQQLPQHRVATAIPLAVHPGDWVHILLQQWIPGIWAVVVQDTTTATSWHTGVLYNGPLQTADWMLEPPLVQGKTTELPPLTTPEAFHSLALRGTAFEDFAVNMGRFPQVQAAPSPLRMASFTVSHP